MRFAWVAVAGIFLSTPSVLAQDRPVESKAERIQQCQKMIDQANALIRTKKYEEARIISLKAKELAISIPFEKGIYNAWNSLALNASSQKKDSTFLAIVQEIRNQAKGNSLYGENEATFQMLRFWYQKGENDSAAVVWKTILKHGRPIGDSVHVMKANQMMGNLYYMQGRFKEANTCFVEAANLAEGMKDDVGYASLVGSLGSVNKAMGDLKRAVHYQIQAIRLRKKLNMTQDLAGAYNNLAALYAQLKKDDSASFFYHQALSLFKQLKSENNTALAQNNIGVYYSNTSFLDSSLIYLTEANRYFIKANDSVNLASNYWALGDVWHSKASKTNEKPLLKKALDFYNQAKDISVRLGLSSIKMSTLDRLAQIHTALGNTQVAQTYLREYVNIADSVQSKEYNMAIAEMQTRFETQQKESQIQKLDAEKQLVSARLETEQTRNLALVASGILLLVAAILSFLYIRKKREAEKQKAILEKQNAIETMRTKIALDVHDDMGSGLTKIGLNARQLQSLATTEKQKQLAEKMAEQSKEVIAGMKEIIWASNPANDNLKSMLGFMRTYIDRFFDGTEIRPVVRFPLNVGEVVLHPEVRRNLFLILKESLNNAVKYSGTDQIEIDFENQSDQFRLRIKDYGKGLSSDKTDDFSNGLRNMQARAEQIKAVFSLQTEEGNGVLIAVEGRFY